MDLRFKRWSSDKRIVSRLTMSSFKIQIAWALVKENKINEVKYGEDGALETWFGKVIEENVTWFSFITIYVIYFSLKLESVVQRWWFSWRSLRFTIKRNVLLKEMWHCCSFRSLINIPSSSCHQSAVFTNYRHPVVPGE